MSILDSLLALLRGKPQVITGSLEDVERVITQKTGANLAKAA